LIFQVGAAAENAAAFISNSTKPSALLLKTMIFTGSLCWRSERISPNSIAKSAVT
jgi:hypothetical protein